MRFRYTSTTSGEFGSCFTGCYIFLNDGELLKLDSLCYPNHHSQYFEIDFKGKDFRIVGCRGNWSPSNCICIGSIQFKVAHQKYL